MKSRKSVVYFLGAGSSKAFGYPLTNEILKEILLRLRKKNLFTEIDGSLSKKKLDELHDNLLAFLYKLWPGLKSGLDSDDKPLITDFLSLIDFMNNNNHIPYAEIGEISSKRQLLVRAMLELLAEYDEKVDDSSEERLRTKFLAQIIKESKHCNLSIITTNYDLSIDYGITNLKQINYGFPYRDASGDGRVIREIDKPQLSLLKLHGSLNWLSCEICGNTYINKEGSILFQAFRSVIDENNSCHCDSGNKRRLKEVIVSPSMVRDIRDANLLQVWRSAIESLRTADEWNIIGYSLPSEDLAIRSIFVRALNGHSQKPVINIIQKGDVAKSNYRYLFGEEKDAFKYFDKGLEEWLNLQRN